MSATTDTHHELGFVRKYIFSVDHKVIAKQYLFLGIAFLLLAGAFALLIRWQLAYPFQKLPVLFADSDHIMPPESYNMLFTMHGALMVFFAITPIVIGAFGNFVIPLQIGAGDMAFPKLNMLSFWTMFVGGVIMIASFFVPGGAASAGWTGYAPLSSNALMTIGWGQTMWILGIAMAGTSSLMGSINYIATTLNMRCPGMTLMRMPLTTWGLFFTSVLNLLWIPVVAAALFLLLLDRVGGTTFFLAGPLASSEGGQPLLYQHLFWGFGHPEVYILIFPVWGLVGDLLSVFARKPAFGYKATVYSMAAITVVSQIVWGHHMFTSGMNPIVGHTFVILTVSVSVPTAIFFLNWLCTIWHGSLRLDTPMLFALGIVFVFGIGGLTGLFNALQAVDLYIHDTYFVVAHFHYTLAASVLFGALAGIYYWFPSMFGRQMNNGLGKWHFWLTFISLNAVFIAMFALGIAGHPRRVATGMEYQLFKSLAGWNKFAAHSTMMLGAVQLLFVWNFFHSLVRGKRAEMNPWKASSLEWTVSWPQPHGNFETVPEVHRGPHDFSSPEYKDRDWMMQSEEVPPVAT